MEAENCPSAFAEESKNSVKRKARPTQVDERAIARARMRFRSDRLRYAGFNHFLIESVL
jgi:hypothetical protein